MNLDNCLFRFRPLEISYERDYQILNNLEKGYEFFSTPIHFNDPFDSLIYVDSVQLINMIAKELDENLDDYINGIGDMCFRKLLEFENDDRNPRKNLNRMLYYGKIVQVREKVKEQFQNNIKEICFSENIKSVLMWSHYANDHKGFCIVYDIDELKKVNCYDNNNNQIDCNLRLNPIRYTNIRVDMTKYMYEYIPKYAFGVPDNLTETMNEPSRKYLEDLILTKAKVWEYEREWRLYSTAVKLLQPNSMSYIKVKPKAIIVGTKTNGDNYKKLKRISGKKKISMYRMELADNNGFELEIV